MSHTEAAEVRGLEDGTSQLSVRCVGESGICRYSGAETITAAKQILHAADIDSRVVTADVD